MEQLNGNVGLSRADRDRMKRQRVILSWLANLLYAGAVVYLESLFLSLLGHIFPTGPLGFLAGAGAVVGGASAILLGYCLGKWFSPGAQFFFGVVFLLTELTVLAMNGITAYQIYQQGEYLAAVAVGTKAGIIPPVVKIVSTLPDLLQNWYYLLPVAGPITAMIGWAFVAHILDASRREVAAEYTLRDAELTTQEHGTEALAEQRLEFVRQFVAAGKGAETVAIMRAGAAQLAQGVARALSGNQDLNVQAPTVVDAQARDVTPLPARRNRKRGWLANARAVVNKAREAWAAALDDDAPEAEATAMTARDVPDLPRVEEGAPPVDAGGDDAKNT